MCTAVSFKTKDHYFGRTLDIFDSYGETLTITPRNYPFKFRIMHELKCHYAIIGMAKVVNNYPLYFDATNEKGLSMAGLNFPDNASYKQMRHGADNVTPYEFIPYILCQCSNISEAKYLLNKLNLINISFSPELPLTPLHWIISDQIQSITVECVEDGLKVYENPIGVLTNNPPFEMQMTYLNMFMGLSPYAPENKFSKKIDFKPFSFGMGALGLPGDLSSPSRFVRASFVKLNSFCGSTESESVSQFFHILGSVRQQKGCVIVDKDHYEYTVYTTCCNTDKGIFYYTTYENNQITGVNMHNENLESNCLITYPLVQGQQIKMIN